MNSLNSFYSIIRSENSKETVCSQLYQTVSFFVQQSVEHLQRLFEKFVPKVLDFRRHHCKELIPTSELNAVASLCVLFDALATEENGVSNNFSLELTIILCHIIYGSFRSTLRQPTQLLAVLLSCQINFFGNSVTLLHFILHSHVHDHSVTRGHFAIMPWQITLFFSPCSKRFRWGRLRFYCFLTVRILG